MLFCLLTKQNCSCFKPPLLPQSPTVTIYPAIAYLQPFLNQKPDACQGWGQGSGRMFCVHQQGLMETGTSPLPLCSHQHLPGLRVSHHNQSPQHQGHNDAVCPALGVGRKGQKWQPGGSKHKGDVLVLITEAGAF